MQIICKDGHCLSKIDLECSKEMHDLFNDYSLTPELLWLVNSKKVSYCCTKI